VRTGVLIALVALAVGVSTVALRLSGHAQGQLVGGPLGAGGSAEVRALDGGTPAAIRRLGGATVRAVRVRGPERRTTFASASHPQRRPALETEVRKYPVVLPKDITPAAAYRLRSQGVPGVTARITGLNSTQGQADPPDVAVAAGPTAIVEMVNTVYAMWSRSGQLLDSGRLDQFFTSSGVNREGDEVTDPRVLYDPRSGRWFTVLFDVTRAESLVGVSDTSDPTGGWKLVANDFTPEDVGGTCPDQPRLGLSDDVVVVGVDLFENCEGGALKGGVVMVLDKPAMLAGGPVAVGIFGGTSAVFTQITPAISLGATGPDYLVSIRRDRPTIAFLYTASDPKAEGVPFQQIQITRMDPPPNAPQKGSPIRIDTGDDRVQNARWESGVLTFVASDACTPGKVPLACARLAQISSANARLSWEKELLLGGGRYLFYPAVESDGAGNLLLVFGYSSGVEYPGVGAVTLQPSGTFSSWTIVKKGTAPHRAGRFVPRYGDYFGIGQDPVVPHQVWAGGEYGAPLQRGLGWATQVFAMTASSANPPPPPPPDRKRPSIRPRAASVLAGTQTKLYFTVKDNSGWTLVTGQIGAKKFRSQELANGTYFFKWRAPSRFGALSFCLTAIDSAGNTSKRTCGRIRVT
jgi:hypothetical protein